MSEQFNKFFCPGYSVAGVFFFKVFLAGYSIGVISEGQLKTYFFKRSRHFVSYVFAGAGGIPITVYKRTESGIVEGVVLYATGTDTVGNFCVD